MRPISQQNANNKSTKIHSPQVDSGVTRHAVPGIEISGGRLISKILPPLHTTYTSPTDYELFILG